MDSLDFFQEELGSIRTAVQGSARPLIFFHDDADGLSSFLQIYRAIGEGKGVVIKATPMVTAQYLRKVAEYQPDAVFSVDLAMMEQEFADQAKTPIHWIDHHEPQSLRNVHYYNPRVKKPDIYVPASHICYEALHQNMWIALVGSVGDWYLPYYAREFSLKRPGILPGKVSDPETALFGSKIGTLAQMFNFLMKGTVKEAEQAMKILTRINNPEELLEGTTSGGRFLKKRYEKLLESYMSLREKALKIRSREKILSFTYSGEKYSFTKDLANELIHRFPKKVIVIGREHEGKLKMSFRSKEHRLPEAIKNALKVVPGTGGGHEYAAAAIVDKQDYKKFMEAFSKEAGL